MEHQASSRLAVLLFTDIVGSVALKTRLGDAVAAQLIGRHDELFRREVAAAANAEVLKDTGDGFLAQFATTSDAIMAALRFQYALQDDSWEGEKLGVRVGVHLGEVSELAEDVPGHRKLSGLAVDVAARVMGLAMPGQILMTRAAFDSARQYVREHPSVNGSAPKLEWLAHGPFLFHGSEEAIEVFEVGVPGVAPLQVPADGEKAKRLVADDEVLGWRPGSGMPVPGREQWILDRHLGEGGFGEVWLAIHTHTGSRRVFKFCYDTERLESFKRELALVRLLRENLGERPDIARMYEVRLDEPPYFLESEYTSEGSIVDWAAEQGGIDRVPLATRIDLVARMADAVAAAHSVGVLHKDLKPANTLIYLSEDGEPRPQLTDFGIGRLADPEQVEIAKTMVDVGISSSLLTESSETHTGTLLYAPPETLIGKPFTIQGDVYELGVMLYQLVVGDLERPLGQGWERDVPDALLRADIADCVAGDENERLGSAKELAERLRTLPKRRRAARRRHAGRLTAAAFVVMAGLLATVSAFFWQERTLRHRAETAEQVATTVKDFMVGLLRLPDPARVGRDPLAGREVKVVDVLALGLETADEQLKDQPEVLAEVLTSIGMPYKELSVLDKSEEAMRRALEIRQGFYEGDDPALAESLKNLGDVLWFARRYDEALPLYDDALAMSRRLFDEVSPEVAAALNNRAACLNAMGQSADAEKSYREVLKIRQALHDEGRIDLLLIGATQNNLATCVLEQARLDPGRFDEAEELFRSGLQTVRTLYGDDHIYTGKTLHNLALCMVRQGKYAEAEPMLLEALPIKRAASGNTAGVAQTLYLLAETAARRGGWEEADGWCHEALDIQRPAARAEEASDSVRLIYAESLQLDGLIHLGLGDAAAAEPSLREAVVIRQRADAPAVDVAETQSALGECLTARGKHDEAEPLLVESFPAIEAHYGETHEVTQRAVARLIDLYQQTDRPEKAAEYLALRRTTTGSSRP